MHGARILAPSLGRVISTPGLLAPPGRRVAVPVPEGPGTLPTGPDPAARGDSPSRPAYPRLTSLLQPSSAAATGWERGYLLVSATEGK